MHMYIYIYICICIIALRHIDTSSRLSILDKKKEVSRSKIEYNIIENKRFIDIYHFRIFFQFFFRK